MLIEQLNGNWQMQMSCGIQFKAGEQIKDKDIVGRWHSFLSAKLGKLQMSCVQHWKPFMQHVHTGFCDATVYEVEYPTDAKLVWKSCCDVYQMIKYKRKELKLRHSRINHEKTEENEKVWIFFSLLTCNAMQITKRMQAALKEKKKEEHRQAA
ncbi:MAG: hypothetical protein NVS3B8_05620 [Chitinophagaceae bacterium]